MFFGDRTTAQHRMARLYELRLVERFRLLRQGRDGEYHYVLDTLGAYVVAVMANRDPNREVKVRWRTDQALAIATSQRLAHTVGTNDIFVRLVTAARQDPDARLVTWWGERYCKAVLGEVVRPDGLGLWHEAGGSVTFCLEYDRGSEPLGRLGAKAVDYARLEAAWGVPFWVLVVVCPARAERPAPGRRCPARAWRLPRPPNPVPAGRQTRSGRRSTPTGPGCASLTWQAGPDLPPRPPVLPTPRGTAGPPRRRADGEGLATRHGRSPHGGDRRKE